MNPIVKYLVAALLLMGSAAGIMVPAHNSAPAATSTAATIAVQTPTELTSQEAVSIALERAGLTQTEVTRLKTHREKEDGKQVWDVEFRCGDYEYDCTIHAYTGAILGWDKDYEPVKTAPTQPSATEPPATQPPETQPPIEELTVQQALDIALADAGLTAEQVTNVRSRQEMDDGIMEWELEFRCGDYEYDYTVHAYTGAILERDKDFDPPKVAPTEPPATEVTKQTKDEALAIALKHAGLTEAEISRVKCEYDLDDGVPQWEVEFRVGKMEYEYAIHAETGTILEWEKDWDD